MPIVYLDTEAADLLRVSAEMLTGALQARVKRADPDQIISNSLIFQSNKLEAALQQLALPDPPVWDHMSRPHQLRVLLLAQMLTDARRIIDRRHYALELRAVLNAVGYEDDGISSDEALAEIVAAPKANLPRVP